MDVVSCAVVLVLAVVDCKPRVAIHKGEVVHHDGIRLVCASGSYEAVTHGPLAAHFLQKEA
jgi:hypothetical protein